MTWDLTPWGTLYVASEWVLRIAALVLVPQRRTPASARAWLLLILFWPWPGVALYLLVGRAYLPRRRLALQSEVRQTIRRVAPNAPAAADAGWEPSVHWQPGLELAQRRSEFRPVDGNGFELLPDYDAAIARLIADVDGACRYVHLLYYIFENDATGQAVAAALERATRRGVAVRVLADAVGSRQGLKGLGPRLAAAGAEVIPVMPLRLWGPNAARLDLRNHRKIAIVDGETAYFGSQNIVDSHANPGLVNEELAVRATGPVVRQLLALLLADRYLETGDVPPEIDIGPASPAPGTPGGRAQVLPSGPGHDAGSTEAIMIALMHGARSRVVLTAPYVVPSEAFLGGALQCRAARRRGRAHRRQRIQQAAGPARAGVVLRRDAGRRRPDPAAHAAASCTPKHMSVDDDIVLIGSSNLDIRSFVLNCRGERADRRRRRRRGAARDPGPLPRRLRVPVTTAERAALSRGRRTLENLARLTDSV